MRVCGRFSDNELEMAADQLRELSSMLQAAGYDIVDKDALADPGLTIHEVGTARMGSEPRSSIVNRHNQAIDMNLFIGSYERGFAAHRDAEDTALFVIDGQKHFQIGSEDSLRTYVVKRGEYLRWRSVHWHGNMNPLKEWSITLNFAVGPAGRRMVPVGTPVKYEYAQTKMNDYQEQMIAMQAKRRP